MPTRFQAVLVPLGALLACAPLVAQAEPDEEVAPTAAAALFGNATLGAARLAQQRGGTATQVVNDMQLDGVVADNRAVDVVTGSNAISTGALSGASGLPLIVQNSGNNVLIQNATIVNVQLK